MTAPAPVLSFTDALAIVHPDAHFARRRVRLHRAALAMLDRASGTIAAAKIVAGIDYEEGTIARAGLQLKAAQRLQRWANHWARRAAA